jgi:dipeptidyl aminopeptidase/acylaminoacyl peptidase
VRRELESVEIPGESDARARTWNVLSAAFTERQPVERPSRRMRLALAVAIVVAALAAVFSSPGRAVLDEIREVVGVERAQPALFSLPSPGRLLVASDAGVWIVQQDGSKRLLGEYREASWSPFGRFVVAARENELAALEPDGDVRWTLARPGARFPRWTGTATDTRIAYVDRTGIRVVAGDGMGDRVLVPGARGPIAWRPGDGFVLAHVTSRAVRVLDTETGRTLWTAAHPRGQTTTLAWSADGRRLLVGSPGSIAVFERTALRYELGPRAAPIRAAALAPDGTSLVFAQQTSKRGQLWVVPRIRPDASAARRLLSGPGGFDDVSWTIEGRWVLAAWPSADQWVLLRSDGSNIRAIANVTEQFRSHSFPRVQGWCCAP